MTPPSPVTAARDLRPELDGVAIDVGNFAYDNASRGRLGLSVKLRPFIEYAYDLGAKSVAASPRSDVSEGGEDREFIALAQIVRALKTLTESERSRVVDYIDTRHQSNGFQPGSDTP